MRKSRREFLKYSGTLALGNFLVQSPFALANAKTKSTNNYWILSSSGQTYKTKNTETAKSEFGILRAYNWETKERIEINIPFFGHELLASPKDPHLAVSALKWGEQACLVDLKSKKLLQTIKSPNGTRFFGHCIWSKDAKFIYMSAQNDLAAKGEVLVYNGETLKLIEQIDSGGMFPHQLIFLSNQELMILNQSTFIEPQKKTASTFGNIDLEKNKLSKTIGLTQIGFSHFIQDQKHNSFYVGGVNNKSETSPGDSILDRLSDSLSSPVEIPNYNSGKPLGEVLSLRISEFNPALLAYTVSEAGYLVLYDLDKKSVLLTDRTIKSTKGICFSKTQSDILYVNDFEHSIHKFKIKNSKGVWSLKHLEKAINLGNSSHLNLTEWT